MLSEVDNIFAPIKVTSSYLWDCTDLYGKRQFSDAIKFNNSSLNVTVYDLNPHIKDKTERSSVWQMFHFVFYSSEIILGSMTLDIYFQRRPFVGTH